MISELFARWMMGAVDNAPIIGFLLLALWDMRKAITVCMKHNQEVIERLIKAIAEHE